MDHGKEMEALLAQQESKENCKCGNNKDNCNCKEIAESELRRKLDLLLRTGSLLMESAADTSRIMRTMKRTAAFLGLDEQYIHLFVNWNVLMVNYSDEEHSFTKFQRCEKHGINLTTISLVSKLTCAPSRKTTRSTSMSRLCRTSSPPSAVSHHGKSLWAAASPVVASAYSSVATGQPSSIVRWLPS